MTFLQVEVADGVAVPTLDDPPRRNALNLTLVDEIVAALDDVEARDDVGAVVVTGAAPAFCAGADMEGLKAIDPNEVRYLHGYASLRRVNYFLCAYFTVIYKKVNWPYTTYTLIINL